MVPVQMYHDWELRVGQWHVVVFSANFSVFICEEFDPFSTFDSLIINMLLAKLVSFTMSWALMTVGKQKQL